LEALADALPPAAADEKREAALAIYERLGALPAALALRTTMALRAAGGAG